MGKGSKKPEYQPPPRVRLTHDRLESPVNPAANGGALKLKNPQLVASGRPNPMERGLHVFRRRLARPVMSHPHPSGLLPAGLGEPPSTRAELHIRSMLTREAPANIPWGEVVQNDELFSDSHIRSAIRGAADEFKIPPALLAEHLSAEEHRFLASGMRGQWTTTALGLDDWVDDRETILRRFPQLRGLSETVEPAFPPESIDLFGKTEEQIAAVSKPQAGFSGRDGLRAAAAYIKNKELNLRRHVGGDDVFDSLPIDVRYQATRLMVNPKSSKHDPHGPKWITKRLLSGNYTELFDFNSPLHTAKPGPHRRATFHTVRALHLRDVFFPDEPDE